MLLYHHSKGTVVLFYSHSVYKDNGSVNVPPFTVKKYGSVTVPAFTVRRIR